MTTRTRLLILLVPLLTVTLVIGIVPRKTVSALLSAVGAGEAVQIAILEKQFVLAVGVVEASDFCTSSIVEAWQTDREAAAIELVRLWLRNAGAEAVRAAGVELLRFEAQLAICAPPLRLDDFYLIQLRQPDPEALPLAVLRGYLRKYGISIDAGDLLRGRTFWMSNAD